MLDIASVQVTDEPRRMAVKDPRTGKEDPDAFVLLLGSDSEAWRNSEMSVVRKGLEGATFDANSSEVDLAKLLENRQVTRRDSCIRLAEVCRGWGGFTLNGQPNLPPKAVVVPACVLDSDSESEGSLEQAEDSNAVDVDFSMCDFASTEFRDAAVELFYSMPWLADQAFQFIRDRKKHMGNG